MDVHSSVTAFFHEALTDALKAEQVDAAEPTEFYLVNLLVQFTASRVDDEPLALKMVQASAALPEERARALRDIGDTSLYVSGFFGESLCRRLVDVDYYIAMGGAAYGQLAGLGLGPEARREAYDELSGKFGRFVDVLHSIRSRTNIACGSNPIRLYEEWTRTGSDWIEKRLKASGLFALDAFKRARPVQ